MSLDARRSRESWVDPRTWRVDARFGRGSVSGSILKVGGDRIEAVFAQSHDLPPVGRIGQLTISGGDLDQPIKSEALVRDRVDVAKDLLMFGFELRRSAEQTDVDLFAQRRAVRIPLPGGLPLHATIGSGAGTAQGRIRDISVTGVSLACPAAAELTLNLATAIEISFNGTSLGDQRTRARIQHRRFEGNGLVLYGIAFTGGALPHIDRLVMELQFEQARTAR